MFKYMLAMVFSLWGVAQAAPTPLRLDQLYASVGVRGLVFSAQTLALEGKTVALEGYVAPNEDGKPPVLFILSPALLQECPYCTIAADWPNDVEGMWRNVLVLLPAGQAIPAPGSRVRVTGRLELGNKATPVGDFANVATPVRVQASGVEVLGR